MADLTFSTNDPISAPALNAIARHEAIWSTVAATTTSATSAVAIIATGGAMTFEKKFSTTSLRFDMATALTSSAASTLASIGVIISFTPTVSRLIGSIYFVTGFDVPEPVSGVLVFPGVPPGTLAITPIFIRNSGAGTITSAAGYPLSLAVREVNG